MSRPLLPNLFAESDVRPFRFSLVIAAIVVFTLMTRSANSQEVTNHTKPVVQGKIHWTTSYQEALDTANESNLPVMLFFSGSDWCPWCEKLKNEVFATAEFAKWTDSRVIPVMLDFPKTKQLPANLARQNNLLLSRYRPHLSGFPTALFVKPDGKVIGKIGYEAGGTRVWIHKAQKIVGKLDKVAALTMPLQFVRF